MRYPESCWELIVDGRRLHPQFIVRSVWAATLQDCQRECEDVLFNCETIAYGSGSIYLKKFLISAKQFPMLRRQNQLKNTTCDLSDWEAATLSVQPYATDTISAPTFNVYSRYGRYPNEPYDERRCNRVSSSTDASYRPSPTKLQQAGTTLISEDGESSAFNVFMMLFMRRRWPEDRKKKERREKRVPTPKT